MIFRNDVGNVGYLMKCLKCGVEVYLLSRQERTKEENVSKNYFRKTITRAAKCKQRNGFYRNVDESNEPLNDR